MKKGVSVHELFGYLKRGFQITFVAGCLLLPTFSASAQSVPDPDEIIQALLPQADEDLNYEELYEILLQRYSRPIDLNRASDEVLKGLQLLTTEQVLQLRRYIAQNGKLLSIFELQAVEGFDLATIRRIQPFVTVHSDGLQADLQPLWKKIREEDNQHLIFRYSRLLARQRGFTLPPEQNGFLGSPDKWYVRYRNSHTNDYSMGFTLEKDAGERFGWPRAQQAGFFSAHFAVYNRRWLKALIIGDYLIQSGQGLVLSAGFQLGKGAESVAGVRRSQLGVLPYTAVQESGFFRGVAATIGSQHLSVTPFFSVNRLDGNLRVPEIPTEADTDVSSDASSNPLTDSFLSSVYRTGLHRNHRELQAMRVLPEMVGGAALQYHPQGTGLIAGANFAATQYGVPIIRTRNQYNQFEFSGSTNWTGSLFATYDRRNFSFFGEAGRSASGGTGGLAGWISSLSSKVEWAFLFRHYDRHFHTFYGAAFGEGTRNINETGWYTGWKMKVARQWAVSAYVDLFRFPWLRFLTNAPSDGVEYLLRLSWQPARKVLLYGQYRYEQKARNIDRVPVAVARMQYLFNLDYRTAEGFMLRSRLQGGNYQIEGGETTVGYAFLQDIELPLLRSLKLAARFAIFDTEDYNTRQYAYEKNVLYLFSIPAYYGRGTRRMMMATWKASRNLRLEARYAISEWADRNVIGSGLDRIEGNKRPEITVQVMYRL